MSFAATLDDLSFPELLHLLAFNRRNGKLTLTARDRHVVLVFRRGRVVHAASASLRDSIGSLLLHRGFVTESDLRTALDRQDPFDRERRLEEDLVEMGKLSSGDRREAAKQQILQVMAEVFQWKTGFFRLDPVANGEGVSGRDPMEPFVGGGFDSEALLFEAVTALDAPDADGSWRAVTLTPAEASRGVLHVPAEWEAPAAASGASLGSLVAEIQAPAFTGEVALALMRYASQVMGRGIFFAVTTNEARAIGQFGLEESAARALRRAGQIKVPLSEPSLLSEVVDRREIRRGPLAPHPWNERLVEMLGGQRPGEAIALPLTIARRVDFVLYGDDLPRRERIGRMEGLEYLMNEAGLAMERLAIDRRQRSREETRGRGTPAVEQGRG